MYYHLYQPEDFARLYAIEEACFHPPLRFPRAYMRQLVNSPRTATWVAEDRGELAGFAIAEWLRDIQGSVAYVETIEVAEAYRKKGIGAELLSRIENSARSAGAQAIWLHVDAENASAIRLYERHGYEFQGIQEHYYANYRAALVYSKPLHASAAHR